jgi:hypothetical protein
MIGLLGIIGATVALARMVCGWGSLFINGASICCQYGFEAYRVTCYYGYEIFYQLLEILC